MIRRNCRKNAHFAGVSCEGDMGAALPDVPFYCLTNAPLSRERGLAKRRMDGQTLRMNLIRWRVMACFENATLAASVNAAAGRQGASAPVTNTIAHRCCRHGQSASSVPQVIRGESTAQAMEYALESIPSFRGNVVNADASRVHEVVDNRLSQGATSKIRCGGRLPG